MSRKLIRSNSGKIGITYTQIYRTGIDYFTNVNQCYEHLVGKHTHFYHSHYTQFSFP